MQKKVKSICWSNYHVNNVDKSRGAQGSLDNDFFPFSGHTAAADWIELPDARGDKATVAKQTNGPKIQEMGDTRAINTRALNG